MEGVRSCFRSDVRGTGKEADDIKCSIAMPLKASQSSHCLLCGTFLHETLTRMAKRMYRRYFPGTAFIPTGGKRVDAARAYSRRRNATAEKVRIELKYARNGVGSGVIVAAVFVAVK